MTFLGFPVGGSASPPDDGRQHTNFPIFQKKCKTIFEQRGRARAGGAQLDPPLLVTDIWNPSFYLCKTQHCRHAKVLHVNN